MATYVIGDLQGMFKSLQRLLTHVNFEPLRDHLWFVGDLVNRGPDNVATLRFIKGLGAKASVVLGNHDLHLIKVWLQRGKGLREEDTLEDILSADDCDELVRWLMLQPLIKTDGPWTMVHAGLLPTWSLSDALTQARTVEAQLRDINAAKRILENGVFPHALRVLTTIRMCNHDLTLCKHVGPPETAEPTCFPWFDHPLGVHREGKILFGHWSSLGHRSLPHIVSLDTGVIWGGPLTALRLEDERVFQIFPQD